MKVVKIEVALANEIIQYLDAHPNAADTAKGIVQWWLQRQRYEDLLQDVQNALDYLEERGSIKKVEVAEGGVIYSSAQSSKEERKQ